MRKKGELLRGLPPVHPGALLREDILPHVDMTKSDVAKALGISRAQLYALLAEKAPVTAAMAPRLGKFLGNGPELWLNMQSTYDLETVAQRMRRDLAHIPHARTADRRNVSQLRDSLRRRRQKRVSIRQMQDAIETQPR